MREELLKILSGATVAQGLESADLEPLLQHATVDIVPQGRRVLAEGPGSLDVPGRVTIPRALWYEAKNNRRHGS